MAYKDPDIENFANLFGPQLAAMREMTIPQQREAFDAAMEPIPLADGCAVETLELGGVPAEKITHDSLSSGLSFGAGTSVSCRARRRDGGLQAASWERHCTDKRRGWRRLRRRQSRDRIAAESAAWPLFHPFIRAGLAGVDEAGAWMRQRLRAGA
jgi:hypothetical protein